MVTFNVVAPGDNSLICLLNGDNLNLFFLGGGGGGGSTPTTVSSFWGHKLVRVEGRERNLLRKDTYYKTRYDVFRSSSSFFLDQRRCFLVLY